MLFLDVDRFKALNSFLGHAAGDQFLQTVTRRLNQVSTEGHFLARLGGDEFVAVMTGPAGEDRAAAYAELQRATANRPVQVGGEEISRAAASGWRSASPAPPPCRS